MECVDIDIINTDTMQEVKDTNNNPYFVPANLPHPNPYPPQGQGPNEPAKKSLFQRITVKASVLGVAAVELVFVGSVLALYLGFYFDLPDPPPVLVAGLCVGLTLAVFAVCFILLLVVGIITRRQGLIQAHLAVQVMSIIVMSSIGTLVLLLNAVNYQFNRELGNQFPAVFLSIGILCLAMAIAEVWFFFIVRDSQLELEKAEQKSASMWWDMWINQYSHLQQQQQTPALPWSHQAQHHYANPSQLYGTVHNMHVEKPIDNDTVLIDQITELNITQHSA